MRLGIDSVITEKLHQGITLLRFVHFDDVKVVNVVIAGLFGRQYKVLRSFETGGISSSPFPAQVIPGIDVFELGAQDSSMQVVQAAVKAVAVNIPLIRAMITQSPNRGVNFLIV